MGHGSGGCMLMSGWEGSAQVVCDVCGGGAGPQLPADALLYRRRAILLSSSTLAKRRVNQWWQRWEVGDGLLDGGVDGCDSALVALRWCDFGGLGPAFCTASAAGVAVWLGTEFVPSNSNSELDCAAGDSLARKMQCKASSVVAGSIVALSHASKCSTANACSVSSGVERGLGGIAVTCARAMAVRSVRLRWLASRFAAGAGAAMAEEMEAAGRLAARSRRVVGWCGLNRMVMLGSVALSRLSSSGSSLPVGRAKRALGACGLAAWRGCGAGTIQESLRGQDFRCVLGAMVSRHVVVVSPIYLLQPRAASCSSWTQERLEWAVVGAGCCHDICQRRLPD
eukprot:677643-Amphidinium_carterae.2